MKLKKNSNFEKNAIKIIDRLKEYQNNNMESFGGGIGALWGTWPIGGSYQPFDFLLIGQINFLLIY